MQMTLLGISCAAAFVAPMVFFLARLLPETIAACRKSRALAITAIIALATFGTFLAMRPHNDTFCGLDCSAMKELAVAFSAGRTMTGPDKVLASVPQSLQKAFWYRSATGARPTRDLSFQLADGSPSRTVPFFTPFLPLAAAGSGMPLHFPALLATLWFAILLSACIGKGGRAGISIAAALLLATPWPCWFFRGFYTECVGTLLATAALISALSRRMRNPVSFAIAGFALGFAVSVHPILVAVSAPIAIALLPSISRRCHAPALIVGCAAGFAPGWYVTRNICQPYGNWTNPETLATIFRAAPEHRVLMIAAAIACLIGIALLGFVLTTRGRSMAVTAYDRIDVRGRFALALIPAAMMLAAVVACAHGPAPIREFAQAHVGTLAKGAASVWTGIRIPCALLWCIATYVLAWDKRQRPAFAALVGIAFASLLFIFIKGIEVPVGIWSERRFLPIAITLTAILAPALAIDCVRLPRATRAVTCIGILALGLVSPIRWTQAYIGINEQDANKFCKAFRDTFDREGRPLTVFDYFPHAVPYMASLEYPVLGLSAKSPERWPEVAGWIAQVASTGDVCVATSYASTTLEEGFALEDIYISGGRFPIVAGAHNDFLPVSLGAKCVDNRLMRVMPLKNGAPFFGQDKVLDGGPIGLRGPWGATKNGGTWTRQGSGIVGPVPPSGTVSITIDASWFPPEPAWSNQTLKITAPWGEAASIDIHGDHQVETIEMEVHDGTSQKQPTGIYQFAVERPYDPAKFGLRGYDSDLGVFLYRAQIRGGIAHVDRVEQLGHLDMTDSR